MRRDRLVGVLLIALSASCFGAMAIFARFAYADGADAVAILFLRFALATAILTVVMLATGRKWPRGRNLAVLCLMGGICYVAQSLSFFTALHHAAAGLVALLLYLYPFLVTVMSALLLRRRLSASRLFAVLFALAGAALTIGGSLAGKPLGIALGLAAAVIYSVYILVGGLVLRREDPLAAATVVMAAAAGVFGVIAALDAPSYPASWSGWFALLAIAIVSTVFAMVSLFAGLRRVGPADAATLSTLEPVVTVVLAAIFLSEPVSLNQLLGGLMILAAIIWLARAADGGPIVDVSPDGQRHSAVGEGAGRSSAS